MKKTIFSKGVFLKALAPATLLIAAVSGNALAAGGHGVELREAHIDVQDKLSLQRGARLFTNYCLSCHSASFVRYERVAEDLGIEQEMVLDNLVNTANTKIGDTMEVAMKAGDAKTWFGKPVPDLSVIARARGKDWLYTYLTSFYADSSKEIGVNNLVFKDVGMPHVLWELQGWQKPVIEEVDDGHGKSHTKVVGVELATEGAMTPREYDKAVRDLVNFLVYIGEPAQLKRAELGPFVIGFLIIFTFVAYLLKKEYWRDVH